LQLMDPLVPGIRLTALQASQTVRQKHLSPRGQRRCVHLELAAERIQVFTLQQTQDCVHLLLRGPAASFVSARLVLPSHGTTPFQPEIWPKWMSSGSLDRRMVRLRRENDTLRKERDF